MTPRWLQGLRGQPARLAADKGERTAPHFSLPASRPLGASSVLRQLNSLGAQIISLRLRADDADQSFHAHGRQAHSLRRSTGAGPALPSPRVLPAPLIPARHASSELMPFLCRQRDTSAKYHIIHYLYFSMICMRGLFKQSYKDDGAFPII